MGSFFGWLGGIFSSLGSAGASLLKTAAVLAIDIGAALLGGKTVIGQQLKNKTISASTYGRPLPRARGTVRLNGNLIWWNGIQETTHKNTSGGIFGIGQTSVYTYTYSVCAAFAFGKKLGGGAAVRYIRLWADGKLLYDSLTDGSSLTGTATIVGTVPADSQSIPVSLSGGSLTLKAGDLIQFGVYQIIGGVNTFVQSGSNTYEVQQDITVASGASGAISVYPPTDVDLTATSPITVMFLPGQNNPIVDLASFDPDPHDGSHVVGNPVAQGTIRFHYGSDAEQPDPLMVAQYGPQAPAYRGLTYVMLEWLQLANYGNHVPSLSAEIAFDTASGTLPAVQIPNATVISGGGGPAQALIPKPQASSASFQSPNVLLPYIWFISGSLPNLTLYKIDANTNQVVSSVAVNTTGGLASNFAIDSGGYIFFVSGGWTMFKWDGLGMTTSNAYAINTLSTILPFDVQASAFGSPVVIALLAGKMDFGGVQLWDRKVLRPVGALNPASSGEVILFWDSSGKAIVGPGDAAEVAITADPSVDVQQMTVDKKGNLYIVSDGTLTKMNCMPQSGVYIDPISFVPSEVLYPPSFAITTCDVSAITGGSGNNPALLYDPSDDSIVVMGSSGLCKVSCSTMAITLSNTATPPWSSGTVKVYSLTTDQLGSFIVNDGDPFSPFTTYRYDSSTLQQISSYSMTGIFPSGRAFALQYDTIANTLWGDYAGGLYRIYLDRGAGGGVGLDAIVGALFAEAGYDSSEYNVTALAAISTQGYEIDQEPYGDSIKKLQQLFLFDLAEIDGVIVCVPRSSGPGSFTIPEEDLGATDFGTAPAARVTETLQQETDVPQTVWVQYYDSTKELQQATQYAKRIAQPYDTALASNPKVTNSRNQLNVSIPVTDEPPNMKQAAQNILLDAWQSRMRYGFKTGIKWVLLDPTDKGAITYKGETLAVRISEADLGAAFAREFQGVAYDSGVYSVPAQTGGGGGSPLNGTSGSSVGRDAYTLSPQCPLSQTSATTLAMAGVVATFDDGTRLAYNARTLTISDPGAGNTQIYYVSIVDTSFAGEVPGTASLTVIASTTPAGAHWGEEGYINVGAYLAAGVGATGVEVSCGGWPAPVGAGTPSTIGIPVVVEVPSGTVNANNKIFTASRLPNPLSSLQVYLNGVQQVYSVQYSVSGQAITFVTAPSSDDQVLVFYRADGLTGKDSEIPSGSINGSNSSFSLAAAPSPTGSLLLYLNGVELIPGTDYSLSGSTLTMTNAPSTGDSLVAFYRTDGNALGIADNETPSGTINGTNKAFSLANAAISGTLLLFLNELALTPGVDFTYAGAAITFVNAPSTGGSLRAFYRYGTAPVSTSSVLAPLMFMLFKFFDDSNGNHYIDWVSAGGTSFIALIGSSDPNYVGCQVWVKDGLGNYENTGDVITGSTPFGSLTANLSPAANPDGTNSVHADFTASGATPPSAIDFSDFALLIEGGDVSSFGYELISYASGSVVGFAVTGAPPLVRGYFGEGNTTTASNLGVSHSSGARVAIIDLRPLAPTSGSPVGTGLYRVPPSYAWFPCSWGAPGATISLKFPARLADGAVQAVADATEYSFTVPSPPSFIDPNYWGFTVGQSPFPPNNMTDALNNDVCLSQPTPDTIHMSIAYNGPLLAYYAERTISIPTPTGPITYYVTIDDPLWAGEASQQTPGIHLLPLTCSTSAPTYNRDKIYFGSITVVPAGGGSATPMGHNSFSGY